MAAEAGLGVDRTTRERATREQGNLTSPDCGLARHDPDASHGKACGHVIDHDPDASP